jgi:hypothetical protein
MTKHQSPTTGALIEALKELVEARDGYLATDCDSQSEVEAAQRLDRAHDAARDLLEALSRPSPIAEPQDSDAAWLRENIHALLYNGLELRAGVRSAAEKRLERIAARLEAPIAEDALVERGWQPIETAPRDGTGMLIRSPEGDIGIGFMFAEVFDGMDLTRAPAAWYGKRPYERTPSVWMGRFDANEATHWMPLPESPNA